MNTFLRTQSYSCSSASVADEVSSMKVFQLSLLVIFAACAQGLLHHLKIYNDDRNVFKIETFGFLTGGEMNITISSFSVKLTKKEKDIFKSNTTETGIVRRLANETTPIVTTNNATVPAVPKTNAPVVAPVKTPAKTPTKNNTKEAAPQAYKIGFVMRRALSESTAQQDLERIIENSLCIFDHLEEADVVISLNNVDKWKHVNVQHVVDEKGAGLYSLIFARCVPSGSHLVNFNLDATFYNPGPNYLSAGDTPLPNMYFAFFVAFTIALGVWIYVLRRDTTVYGTVHRIHYMMLILLSLKVASLLFESVRYHYIAMYGVSETWSIVYYIFAFLKGVMLFTVILLIGSGWSLMKSYLNGQEKKIIFVVLILQVLDNIAMIVLEESAPGSQGWLTWRDVLHLVDIICCVAILLPIVWSIRHLRLAAEVDGKAHNSLVKLQLFRQFYVMVVVYIYFTRIVVYLITSTVSFHLLWLGPFSTEAATFVFYVVTGFKFRPALDNPYLAVRTEDIEGGDYGLDEGDDGVEMQLK